jgi:hypothetical protein
MPGVYASRVRLRAGRRWRGRRPVASRWQSGVDDVVGPVSANVRHSSPEHGANPGSRRSKTRQVRTAQRRLRYLAGLGLGRPFWAAGANRARGRHAFELTREARLLTDPDGLADRPPDLPASPPAHQLDTLDILAAFLRRRAPSGAGGGVADDDPVQGLDGGRQGPRHRHAAPKSYLGQRRSTTEQPRDDAARGHTRPQRNRNSRGFPRRPGARR